MSSYDVSAVKQAASGRWPDIIARLGGVGPAILDGQHHACPRCGGTDRFRAFDDFAQTGGVYCNQCHSDENGDGISTVRWLCGMDFPGALRAVAGDLGIAASANGNAKSDDLRSKLEFSDNGDTFLAALLPAWCERKPPIRPEAVKALDGKFCRWPKGSSAHRCIALDGRKIDGDNATLAAILLYSLDAPEFPAFGNLQSRKTHLVKGSKESWIWAGNVEALRAADTIVKVEGPSDLLALLSIGLPAGWVAMTNSCGAKSANPTKLDFTWATGKRIVIVGDADASGQEGAKKFCAAFHKAGAAEVRMVQLPYEVRPDHGKDLRDWLAEGHTAADFQALADAAPIVTPQQAAEWGRKRRQRFSDRQIIIGVDESRVVDEAVAALAAREDIFQRGGMLVEVVRGGNPPAGIARPKDAPRIGQIRTPRLRELLAASAEWITGGEEPERTHPPAWAVASVDARGQWPSIRRLEGVTEIPVLRADGSVLQRPGYDPDTGLLFEPQHAFPEIPSRPGKADAERARDSLLDVVVDFPFAADAHRAAWVASVLTPIARYAYYGPAPMFLIDANVRGCGKTLLTDAAGLIVCGRSMARMTAPRDDDEFRKRITALALAGEPTILIDNVSGMLGSPSLDAALTATSWSDRVLGRTEMVTLPLLATWYATGNNIIVVADTARRIDHIRLESSEETPEERSGFHHADLLAWVRENRPRLAAAAVTIVAGYCAAGRPDMRLTPWGSFEGWSALVRSAVVWAGMPDPASTRRELATQADRDAAALRMLLEGLLEMDPDSRGVSVATMVKRLGEYPDEYEPLRAAIWEAVPSRDGRFPTPRSIGQKLHHLRHRVIGGRFLDSKDAKMGILWLVRQAESGGKGAKVGNDSAHTRARTHAPAPAHEDGPATGNVNSLSPLTPGVCPGCGSTDPVETQAASGKIAINCRQCGHFFTWKDAP